MLPREDTTGAGLAGLHHVVVGVHQISAPTLMTSILDWLLLQEEVEPTHRVPAPVATEVAYQARHLPLVDATVLVLVVEVNPREV